MKLICALVLTSTIVAATCGFFWRIESMPYFLKVEAKPLSDSQAQLFVDYGHGYSEKESTWYQLKPSNKFEEILFPLFAKEIRSLRFDPFQFQGSMEIKSISIQGLKKNSDKYQILHQFNFDNLNPRQGLIIENKNNQTILIESRAGNADPILELPLAEPLKHWEFMDFLDKEWLNQSCFLFLIITPIIVSLSFLPQGKKKDLSSIKFSIEQNEAILRKGEIFRLSKAKNFYRDTNEDNLSSIITEVKKGKKWQSVVHEKFAEKHPWLHQIITSHKRTKFLDEYIKPKGQRILDIGAGWGQFSVPLAKNNSVCALEPTPERLDFIQATSKQENVFNNLSFIGASYQDIEFQTKFDLILSIGVLEWVGKFTNSEKHPETDQFEFLKKIKSDLTEEGKLVIGIENRIGLKYILGANDDHIGIPHIAYFTKELSKTKYKQRTKHELQCLTYSLQEYENILVKAGFSKIRFFAALPDYKLPEKIFPISNDHKECKLNKFVVEGGHIKEHDGSNGEKLKNQNEISSMYKSLAEMNIAHFFCPSFFIIAS